MFWIALGCVVVVAVAVAVFRYEKDSFDRWPLAIIVAAIMALVLSPVVLWLVRATGGLMPGYSEGVRYGYVTKMSYTGLVWKTHEGRMQVGTGEMAALQEPFSFCVPDKKVRDQIAPVIGTGEKVGLRYRGWWLIPFRLGKANCEIIGVKRTVVPKET